MEDEWLVTGPLIERARIWLIPGKDGGWTAYIDPDGSISGEGATALEAAGRLIDAMKAR